MTKSLFGCCFSFRPCPLLTGFLAGTDGHGLADTVAALALVAAMWNAQPRIPRARMDLLNIFTDAKYHKTKPVSEDNSVTRRGLSGVCGRGEG